MQQAANLVAEQQRQAAVAAAVQQQVRKRRERRGRVVGIVPFRHMISLSFPRWEIFHVGKRRRKERREGQKTDGK